MAKDVENESIRKPGGDIDHEAERERELGKHEVERRRKVDEQREARLSGKRPARA